MSGYLIDRTSGTRIGTMTSNGGLAAAFDGNTSKADAASCRGSGATSQYVGKTLAISRAIDHAVVYPTTDTGYNGNIAIGNNMGSLRLYAKTGAAPANSTDGTLLGTTSNVTNATSGSTTVSSGDTTTIYDHVWVNWNANGGAPTPVTAQIELWQTNQFPSLTAAVGTFTLTGMAALRRINRQMLAAVFVLTGMAVPRSYGRVSAVGTFTLTGMAVILHRLVAPANKFKNRVADFVLQKLRVTAPTLDD